MEEGPLKISRLFFWRSSLQARLIVIISILVLIGVGFGGFYIIRTEFSDSNERLYQHAELITGFLSRSLSLPLWNLDDSTIQGYMDAVMSDPNIYSVAVYEPEEETPAYLRVHNEKPVINPIVNEKDIYDKSGSQKLGKVQVVLTREFMYDAARNLQWGITIITAGLILLLVLGMNFLLRKLVILPLKEMSIVMEEIAKGNSDVEIRTHSSDEVGHLADAFRRMSLYLKNMTAAAKRIAHQDFHEEIQPLSEKDILGEAFHTMTQNLRTMLANIEHSQNQLEKANRDLQSFTYSVSHDLRAPLRVINGFSAILAEEIQGKLSPAGRDALQRVINATHQMDDLIEGLLALSRIGQASLHLQAIPVEEIQTMLQEIIDEVKLSAPDRRVQWKIGELMGCYADRVLLRQVWSNLLYNAFKYTNGKDVALIEVGVEVTEAGKAFFVRDNGVGFDMQYADKLFKEFQRLHAQGEFDGTGIGLAIARRIIDIHNGQIWAEAELGKGASFYFIVPDAPELAN